MLSWTLHTLDFTMYAFPDIDYPFSQEISHHWLMCYSSMPASPHSVTSEHSSMCFQQKSAAEKLKEVDGPYDEEEERTMFLQRVLLDWLAVNSSSETALLHARHFCIGQWYREAYTEIMRQKQGVLPQPRGSKSGSHNKRKRKRKAGEKHLSFLVKLNWCYCHCVSPFINFLI